MICFHVERNEHTSEFFTGESRQKNKRVLPLLCSTFHQLPAHSPAICLEFPPPPYFQISRYIQDGPVPILICKIFYVSEKSHETGHTLPCLTRIFFKSHFLTDRTWGFWPLSLSLLFKNSGENLVPKPTSKGKEAGEIFGECISWGYSTFQKGKKCSPFAKEYQHLVSNVRNAGEEKGRVDSQGEQVRSGGNPCPSWPHGSHAR